jgi:outer membrane protein OmpA-like peptidoglycan-associated protein
MNAKRFLVLSALCLSLFVADASAARAATLENRPPGEFSLLVGLHVADEDVVAADTGPGMSPLFGARWAAKLSPSWNWFFDGIYTSVDNATDDNTNVWEGRTGFERLFPLGESCHWFISGAVGGGDVNFPSPPSGDFGRPLLSLGVGAAKTGGGLRGEVRGETLTGDSGLHGADIYNLQAILGWTFGLPGGGPDSDGDGVVDSNDDCPNTPKGTKVDSRGCPTKVQLFNETRKKVRLEGVNFELESDRLTRESHDILDRVADALHDRPDLKVEVAGHTDNSGTSDYNRDLSQRRAESVRNYLISKGIDSSRLTAKGYGETEPETSNETPEGRAQNRRVELKQIGE